MLAVILVAGWSELEKSNQKLRAPSRRFAEKERGYNDEVLLSTGDKYNSTKTREEGCCELENM